MSLVGANRFEDLFLRFEFYPVWARMLFLVTLALILACVFVHLATMRKVEERRKERDADAR